MTTREAYGLFLHVSRYHTTTFAKDVVIFSLRTIKGVPGSLDGRSWCFFVRDSDSLSSIACSCEPQRAPDGIIEHTMGSGRTGCEQAAHETSLWPCEPAEGGAEGETRQASAWSRGKEVARTLHGKSRSSSTNPPVAMSAPIVRRRSTWRRVSR